MKLLLVLVAFMAMATSADKNLRDPVATDHAALVERVPDGVSHDLINYEGSPVVEESVDGFAPKKPKACWKDGEPRGKGSLPDRSTRQCPENQEMSMGFCYPRCGDKRVGFGPLCVDDCKATIYKSSSILFCCESEDLCADLMDDISSKLPKALAQLAVDIVKNPNDFGKVLRDFRAFLATSMKLRLPMCSKVEFPFLEERVQLIEDQIAELTEEEHKDADVSTGEIIEDFEQETLDAAPNPLVTVN
jgi:hypothetical protein